MNLALLLGVIFLFTFLLGILLEKIRIPWIFAALILGLIFAFYNPLPTLISSESFNSLAQLGMYFLLFLIGFELDLEQIKKLGKFIVKSTFFIIFFEAFFGSLLLHFVFGSSWFVSALVALSFATVGEAVLIPILDEFKLTKTKLGQIILGIGTLDDIIEVLVILVAALFLPFLIGKSESFQQGEVLIPLLSLFLLFIFTFGIIKLRKGVSLIRIKEMEDVFPFILAIFFLFIGLGKFGEIEALGALLAGLAVKNSLSLLKIEQIESQIKTVTYGFFGPIFFFWAGVDTNINYLISHPLLILLVIGVTYIAKILASYLVARKGLGGEAFNFNGNSPGSKIFNQYCNYKIFI